MEKSAQRKTQSTLTEEETNRYSRHLSLPEFGVTAQEKLKAAKVLIIGTGGLGSPAALYLAAAGIGTIGLVDYDTVSLSNLQRQIIHSSESLGKPKVDSAMERMTGLNPLISVRCFNTRLSTENALTLFQDFDLIIDGTDNFPTRYLINDACVLTGKPYVYGSLYRFEGQISVFAIHGAPCYRCLYPSPPPVDLVPSCIEGGILGPVPGIIGTMQALEAIKLITGIGSPLINRLLLLDTLHMRFSELKIQHDITCAICGTNPTITKLQSYDQTCSAEIPGTHTSVNLSPEELLLLSREQGSLQIIDVREPFEFSGCHVPGAVNIPLGTLNGSAMQGLKEKELTVFVCQSGIRSARAIAAFRASGLTGHVKHLNGGMEAWLAQNLPVES